MRGLAVAAVALSLSCGSAGSVDNMCGVTLAVDVTPTMGHVGDTLTATSVLGDPSWTRAWRVTRASDLQLVPFTAHDAAQSAIDVVAAAAGSYDFELSVTHLGRFCSTRAQATVTPWNAPAAAYRLRVTPPVASGLPRQERALVMHAMTPLDHQQLTLSPGVAVAGKLVGPMGAVAGTLRFVSDSQLDVLAATDAAGGFGAVLLPDDRYTLVLVPLDAGLAPRAGAPHTSGVALLAGPFAVDGGALLSGTIADDRGQPVAGARAVLRAGLVASSVGVSDGQGRFTLHAVAGAGYVLAVQTDGWPEVAASPIAVQDGTALDLAFTAARVAVAGSVVASDGVTAMGGARVSIRSSAPLAQVATLSVGGGARAPVGGAVDRAVTTALDGTLPPLALPTGEYDVLVEPPAGATDGATAIHQTLAGAAAWKLALRPRITVRGTVSDALGKPVGGVAVTLRERVGAGVEARTVSDGDGVFQLPGVDPGAGGDLRFDPPLLPDGKRNFPRAHLALQPGATVGDVVLARGLLFRATLEAQSGSALGGAEVEAYCDGCSDPTPAGIASSDGDGRFTLYLPDPL